MTYNNENKLNVVPAIAPAIITGAVTFLSNVFGGGDKPTITYTPPEPPPPPPQQPKILGIPQGTALLIGGGVIIFLATRRRR